MSQLQFTKLYYNMLLAGSQIQNNEDLQYKFTLTVGVGYSVNLNEL